MAHPLMGSSTSDLNMTANEIAKTLVSSRVAPNRLNPPCEPGMYAWFLTPQCSIPGLAPGVDQTVYVGRSASLSRRAIDNHLNSDSTGFSTLRRSLGALLKQKLQLSALPRSTGSSESNVCCYRFDSVGEHRLTEWMHRHLLVSVCAVENPKLQEKAVIRLLCPPLNLTGWANPAKAGIKRLRKICKDEARMSVLGER